MLRRTTGGDVFVSRSGSWWSWVAPVGEGRLVPPAGAAPDLPTDDWPFLYLPRRAIPPVYLLVLGALSVASFAVLRLAGLPRTTLSVRHAHLFLLGAAFLLMEVHAIDRLALLFGTTWIVSAVTIALVLLLILGANLCVAARPAVPYAWSYSGLAAALAASYLVRPEAGLGGGIAAASALGLLMLSPVFFAGLIFARSFRAAPAAAPAMGANILGAVLGGWLEYATMALGVRALVLLAAGLYSMSWILIALRHGRSRALW
jgi:hypothetical protein